MLIIGGIRGENIHVKWYVYRNYRSDAGEDAELTHRGPWVKQIKAGRGQQQHTGVYMHFVKQQLLMYGQCVGIVPLRTIVHAFSKLNRDGRVSVRDNKVYTLTLIVCV